MLALENLPVGYYSFTYMAHDNQEDRSNSWKDIQIKVFEGKRFVHDPNYLITKKCIYHLQPSSTFLTHKDLSLEDSPFKTDESSRYKKKILKFKILSNHQDTAKAHIIQPRFTLCSSTLNVYANNLRDVKSTLNKPLLCPVSQDSNIYMNSKEISNEMNYVLERKMKTRFKGVTLAKPSGLLKKRFKTETGQMQSNSSTNNNWKRIDQLENKKAAIVWGNRDLPSATKQASVVLANTFYGDFEGINGSHVGSIFNLEPDVDGWVETEIYYNLGHTGIYIVIQDQYGSYLEFVDLREIESKNSLQDESG